MSIPIYYINNVNTEAANHNELNLRRTKHLNKNCTKSCIHLLEQNQNFRYSQIQQKWRFWEIFKLSMRDFKKSSNSIELKILRDPQTQQEMTKLLTTVTPIKDKITLQQRGSHIKKIISQQQLQKCQQFMLYTFTLNNNRESNQNTRQNIAITTGPQRAQQDLSKTYRRQTMRVAGLLGENGDSR